MAEAPKYFIGIPEGVIGTITKETPKEINGFFTTDQETCLIIVAIGRGKDKRRLTLCHANQYNDDTKILELFDWAKPDNSDRFIFTTENIPPQFLSTLNNHLEIVKGELLKSFSAPVLQLLLNRKYKFRSYS